MSEKILVTLDMSKINKDKITKREYKNKAGEDISAKDYKIEVIPLKKETLLKQGDGWNMIKTHFVIEGLTPEERREKVEATIIGDGIVFRSGEPEINLDEDF